MQLTDRFSIPPEVLARTVGGEQVILNLSTGMYFGVDGVGADAWQMLADGKALSEILAALLERYDVAAATLQSDIDNLLRSLLEQGLIERSEA